MKKSLVLILGTYLLTQFSFAQTKRSKNEDLMKEETPYAYEFLLNLHNYSGNQEDYKINDYIDDHVQTLEQVENLLIDFAKIAVDGQYNIEGQIHREDYEYTPKPGYNKNNKIVISDSALEDYKTLMSKHFEFNLKHNDISIKGVPFLRGGKVRPFNSLLIRYFILKNAIYEVAKTESSGDSKEENIFYLSTNELVEMISSNPKTATMIPFIRSSAKTKYAKRLLPLSTYYIHKVYSRESNTLKEIIQNNVEINHEKYALFLIDGSESVIDALDDVYDAIVYSYREKFQKLTGSNIHKKILVYFLGAPEPTYVNFFIENKSFHPSKFLPISKSEFKDLFHKNYYKSEYTENDNCRQCDSITGALSEIKNLKINEGFDIFVISDLLFFEFYQSNAKTYAKYRKKADNITISSKDNISFFQIKNFCDESLEDCDEEKESKQRLNGEKMTLEQIGDKVLDDVLSWLDQKFGAKPIILN